MLMARSWCGSVLYNEPSSTALPPTRSVPEGARILGNGSKIRRTTRREYAFGTVLVLVLVIDDNDNDND